MTSWKTKKPPADKPKLINVARGEVLFREGELGEEAFLVKEGAIDIIKFDGIEYVELANLGPGSLFGEMALIDKQARSATARASENAVLEVLDYKAFLAYMRREPGAAWRIMKTLSLNLRKTNERFQVGAFAESEEGQEEGSPEVNNRSMGQIASTSADAIAKYAGLLRFYESRSLSKRTVLTVLLSFLVFCSAVVWLSISSVDTTLMLTGKIVTSSPNFEVQSNFSSVVEDVFVRRGELVESGQRLLRFDDTILNADLRKLELEESFLRGEIARLKQELRIPLDGGQEESIGEEIQRQIFKNRRVEFQSRLEAFVAQERGFRGDIEIQSELEEGRLSLYEKELIPKVELLTTRAQRLNAEKQLASVIADRNAYVSEWIASVNTEYSTAVKTLLTIEQELQKTQRQLADVVLKSPVTGLVLKINNIFPGAVVGSGVAVMTVVPTDEELLAEFSVEPADAGLLTNGAPVRISLDALPYQKHGQIDGEIIYISAEVAEGGPSSGGESVFTALGTLDIPQLRGMPPDFIATPGMSLVGRIKVGDRKLIAYLLYPVVKTLDQSFTEP